MHFVYLLLGSNEGDRKASLQSAVRSLANRAGQVLKQSSLYETAAWGLEDLPPHLNQALLLATEKKPEALLSIINVIENEEGRTRQQRWGMRSLDIDIIYYDDLVLDTEKLTIPHPLMAQRRFVLQPLAEIAAEKIHPVFLQSTHDLLSNCKDPLSVQLLTEV